MTSYWPAWLATSWAIVSRTSFSGRTLNWTLMPVCLVKLSAVSFCRSTICGLLTIRTRTVFEPAPPPPPPPAPALHPASATTPAVAPIAAASDALLLSISSPPGRRSFEHLSARSCSGNVARDRQTVKHLCKNSSIRRSNEHSPGQDQGRTRRARAERDGGAALLLRRGVQERHRGRAGAEPLQGRPAARPRQGHGAGADRARLSRRAQPRPVGPAGHALTGCATASSSTHRPTTRTCCATTSGARRPSC